jgi:predicted TIM-barrel fold metal-dependent hydrolase
VAAYRRLQQRLGTQRTVVVTPSTYGTDNACTLDALDQLGDGARGVAVVAQDVGDAELDRLHARRVRGLRVNFVTPQSWGETTPRMLATLARKAARLPLAASRSSCTRSRSWPWKACWPRCPCRW